MATISISNGLKTLFTLLGALMLALLLYTLITDGFPFNKELLTPWMAATLIDFYINVTILSTWVIYKEANWIRSILWIILLISLGSIATSAYIVLQFLKLSSQESSQDPMSYVLLRHPHKYVYKKTTIESGTEPNTKCSVVATLRILFSVLGVVMLGTLVYTLVTDGSPFRTELLTPWMQATLVDFYINVVALAVWVAYKESSWIYAVFWVILLICFGSITSCVFVVCQLFKISYQDPAYLILVHHSDRNGNGY
ncbi:uncharacterized protein LOC131637485 isoform X2 [Vicia villosa]|uniref:uncharacterized protein LOC131637485 isoform X2 n=1 Tax=Vicia villosa TaxID=3911 RepID=UPI00273C9A15|nr:uncharacterized protein LOC131637485 isoform X2 [Vicia villosa]XP_058764056.1 uncharacterized protein LOC131637485 isoform X2 [Vicia villosa]